MIDWSESAPRWSSLGGDLADEFELMISRGELKDGERLPSERSLAESLGVSRGTVREAMLKLELRGLLSRRPGRGTIVQFSGGTELGAELARSLSSAHVDFLSVMELRLVVEPAVAAAAASSADAAPSCIAELRELLGEADATANPRRLLELDVEFHNRIADAVGNPLLSQMMRTVSDWTSSSRRLGFQSDARRAESLAGHWAILEAIEHGEPEGAATAMRRHLQAIRVTVAGDAAPEGVGG